MYAYLKLFTNFNQVVFKLDMLFNIYNMNKVLVKGHSIVIKDIKSSFDRKAVLFVNNIVEDLNKINVIRDDINVKIERPANRKAPATLEFWTQKKYLRFSYSLAKRFIENLYVVMELIRLEVEEVNDGKKTIDEFLNSFSEDLDRKEIDKELKKAKLTLGLDENETDVEKIDKGYKILAKSHHPDMGGDIEEFQKINKAHKLIKKHMGI